MKPRLLLWIPVLAASHALVYFASGGMAKPAAGGAAPGRGTVEETPAAKTAERKAGGGKHAILLEELIAKGLPEKEFREARTKLLEDWIRDDLAGALDFFFSPESWGRNRTLLEQGSFEGHFKEAIVRQPLAMWQWIRGGRYGSNRGWMTAMWTQAMEADGKRDLLSLAVLEGNHQEQLHGVANWCRRADEDGLAKLRGWLGGLLAGNQNHDDLAGFYTYRLVEIAMGDVGKVFGSEIDPAIRKALCESWMERETEGFPGDLMAARLTELPADVREDALVWLSDRQCREGIAWAARFLEESSRKGLWENLDAGRKGELVNDLVANAHESYADPAEMFGQLAGVSAADLGGQALRKAGELWKESAGEGYPLEVLEGLPAGAKRDAFIEGVLANLDAEDEDFARVLDLISDGELKGKLAEGMEAE